MELKTGDIIACYANRGLVSRIIGWFTASNYSHLGIIYDVWDCGCVIIGEINGTYTYTVREITYKEGQYDVYRYIGDIDKQKIQHQVMRLGGTRYSWLDIIKIALKLPRQYTPKRLICSEAVAEIYTQAGYDLEIPFTPTPEEVVKSKCLYKVK